MRDKQVDAFIKRFQTEVPVDVVGFGKILGVAVYESQDLPAGIAGKILRDKKHGGQGGYSIIVRAADPYPRKRFTVAHELAHYLLHRHLFATGELTDDALYRSGLPNRVEWQANAMAADLLMPWHLLLPRVQAGKSVSDLARDFEVSEQAMKVRLESRGLTQAAG